MNYAKKTNGAAKQINGQPLTDVFASTATVDNVESYM
jgi:hypothetical protein